MKRETVQLNILNDILRSMCENHFINIVHHFDQNGLSESHDFREYKAWLLDNGYVVERKISPLDANFLAPTSKAYTKYRNKGLKKQDLSTPTNWKEMIKVSGAFAALVYTIVRLIDWVIGKFF